MTGSNAAGASAASSAPVGIDAAVPVNSARPSLAGTARNGQRMTCGAGTWSGAPSFAFRWLRNGTAISSATSSTYRLAASDVGRAVQCQVSATNAGGTTVAESAPRVVAQACIVPSLRGATLAAGRRRLARAHCALGKVTRAFSSSVRAGRVIRSSPAAKTNRAAGAKVGVQVSKGRR